MKKDTVRSKNTSGDINISARAKNKIRHQFLLDCIENVRHSTLTVAEATNGKCYVANIHKTFFLIVQFEAVLRESVSDVFNKPFFASLTQKQINSVYYFKYILCFLSL